MVGHVGVEPGEQRGGQRGRRHDQGGGRPLRGVPPGQADRRHPDQPEHVLRGEDPARHHQHQHRRQRHVDAGPPGDQPSEPQHAQPEQRQAGQHERRGPHERMPDDLHRPVDELDPEGVVPEPGQHQRRRARRLDLQPTLHLVAGEPGPGPGEGERQRAAQAREPHREPGEPPSGPGGEEQHRGPHLDQRARRHEGARDRGPPDHGGQRGHGDRGDEDVVPGIGQQVEHRHRQRPHPGPQQAPVPADQAEQCEKDQQVGQEGQREEGGQIAGRDEPQAEEERGGAGRVLPHRIAGGSAPAGQDVAPARVEADVVEDAAHRRVDDTGDDQDEGCAAEDPGREHHGAVQA